jgi:membrane dipeptidase
MRKTGALTMIHRLAPAFVLLFGLALGPVSTAADAEEAESIAEETGPDVEAIHRDALVVDTHSDALYRMDYDGTSLADEPFGAQTTLAKLEQGGVDAQFFSVWVPPGYRDYGYARKTLELIERLHADVERHPDRIQFARTSEDVRRIAGEGRVAALLGIEGGHSIENSLGLLRIYHRLGVRYMTLTWSNGNDWADSSGDAPRWGGLNDFGVRVVGEMNRLGMMVDVSHVSDAAFWDVIRASRAPVIASHSSCRALCDAGRNMSDEMLIGLAGNGGVIQINFYAGFLDQRFRDRSNRGLAAADEQIGKLGEQYLGDELGLFTGMWRLYQLIDRAVPPPPLSSLVDHIDHVVRLVGIDHVGLGSDFDGVTALPIGLEHEGKLPALTAALLERGYDEAAVRQILGGNLMRVMEEVERIAQESR